MATAGTGGATGGIAYRGAVARSTVAWDCHVVQHLYYVDNPWAVADPTATDARAKFLRASRLRSAREGSAPECPANA